MSKSKSKRFGDARDSANYNGSKGTMPARVRDGASYPGGKHLRHAHTVLAARRQNVPNGGRMPGSMKG